MDQASTLRRIVEKNRARESGQTSSLRPSPPPEVRRPPRLPERTHMPGQPRVIAVSSGKGGVGKTNTAVNLSLALSRMKRRVMLLDADMGLANVDVLLGLTPAHTLEHVLDGSRDISEVILEGPLGLRILPSASGISEMSELSPEEQTRLFQELSRIDTEVDYLFIDTGAGISSNVLRFNAAADEVCVVVNPEPTSLTDAYALIKLLAGKHGVRRFSLVANQVASEPDGRAVFERLEKACSQFIQVQLNYLGCVPFDPAIRKAVRQQRALMDLYPYAPAAKALARIANRLDKTLFRGRGPVSSFPSSPLSGARSTRDSRNPQPAPFWDRLLHWKKLR